MALTTGMLASHISPADPNYSSVVSLLHFDGTDLSTTITDNSSYARSYSRFGDTSLRTGTVKIGSASCYFDGTGDYMTNDQAEVAQTASQQFTLEFWFNSQDITTTKYFVCLGDSNSNGRFLCGVSNGNLFARTDAIQTYQGSTLVNTWYHFAMVRNASAVLKGFVNGVEFTTLAGTTATTIATNAVMTIGATDQGRVSTGSTSQYKGFLDDLRYTKGVCRYTSNFTPPVNPYPNH